MDELAVLRLIEHLAEHLAVPALGQKKNVIAAEDIEIILVLSYTAIVNAEEIGKALENTSFSEAAAVDEQHACVKEKISVKSEAFLNVATVNVHLNHRLLVACGEVVLLYVMCVKLCNISLHHSVAIHVYRLVYRGKHICDKHTVVGSV